MAINFDALPKEKPAGDFPVPEEGFHKATVTKPAVKVSGAGNEYLEIQLKLARGGIVRDRIMVSDKPVLQYKISRFVQACKLPLTGELTLKDLGKVTEGKELVVDLVVKENTWKGVTKMQAEVEIFKNDIYYPIEEYASLVGELPEPDVDEGVSTTPGTY